MQGSLFSLQYYYQSKTTLAGMLLGFLALKGTEAILVGGFAHLR